LSQLGLWLQNSWKLSIESLQKMKIEVYVGSNSMDDELIAHGFASDP
jgi:hypothetical protein